LIAKLLATVERVQWVHVQRGDAHHLARAEEAVLPVMIAQNVADVLAEEALDALAEFLNAIYVDLLHTEGPGRVWVDRQRRDLLGFSIVPGDICHKVPDQRK